MSDHRSAPRRRHGAEFKAQVVSACAEPGASVASVGLAFGVNANLVRQWLRGRGFKREDGALALPQALPRAERFVPVALPTASAPAADIRVELRRGNLQVNVSWPPSSAADCAAWLRELLR